jgi:hypothetical protein
MWPGQRRHFRLSIGPADGLPRSPSTSLPATRLAGSSLACIRTPEGSRDSVSALVGCGAPGLEHGTGSRFRQRPYRSARHTGSRSSARAERSICETPRMGDAPRGAQLRASFVPYRTPGRRGEQRQTVRSQATSPVLALGAIPRRVVARRASVLPAAVRLPEVHPPAVRLVANTAAAVSSPLVAPTICIR